MLAPLATAADLQDRGVDVTDTARVAAALDTVSASIRDAAGCAISRITATIKVTPDGHHLPLPGPVLSVDSVRLGDVLVTDYYEDDYGLARPSGWGCLAGQRAAVTLTWGLDPVPADIVDLACNLATAQLNHLAEGGGSTAGLSSVAIDDGRESYTEEAAGHVSPAFLPDATRQWLARRFGSGVTVVGSR